MEMMPHTLRIGWIGFHREGLPALESLLAAGIRVEAVLTLAASQLAKRSGACSYDELCQRFNVPLHKIRHVNDPESVALLRNLHLDVAFVIGWSQIVGREALAAVRLGMVGAHAALLPHNRGSAPVNWSILRGESETGNTLIWLGEEVDKGAILDQAAFPITPYDTCATVYDRVAESNRDMIVRFVARLASGERPGRPQPASDEPLLPRRRPADGAIDWKGTSKQVYDFIRALTRPYPGAFSFLDGRQWLVWDAAHLPGNPYAGAEPGCVIGPLVHPYPSHACGQIVACGEGAIALLEIESPANEVLRGRALSEQPWTGKIWNRESYDR
jgi:methionyl-tRNA formyltransferase